MAGWSWEFSDDQQEAERELVRTPLAGLYMAGYQALSSLRLGGIPTAIQSGRLAAGSSARRRPTRLRGDHPATPREAPQGVSPEVVIASEAPRHRERGAAIFKIATSLRSSQ